MPEWDGLLPPVSCGECPIIDGVRTPVAYSTYSTITLGEYRLLGEREQAIQCFKTYISELFSEVPVADHSTQ